MKARQLCQLREVFLEDWRLSYLHCAPPPPELGALSDLCESDVIDKVPSLLGQLRDTLHVTSEEIELISRELDRKHHHRHKVERI